MANIVVRINGNEVDFTDANELPINITKQTDDLSAIGRGVGSVISNTANRFTLPATKNNCAVIEQAQIATSEGNFNGIMRMTVSIGGSVSFAGRIILVDRIINGNYPKSFSFDTLGDALDLWEILDGVSLRDLSLGSIPWTTANVLASQTGTVGTGYKHIWAPVCYGNTSGPNDPATTSNGALFQTKDLRPSVYDHSILHAIFEQQGYTLESSFLETDYFKDWVYTFGVGDQWQMAQDIDEAQFRIELSANYTLPSPGGGGYFNVRFNNIIQDDLNLWDAVNYWYTVPVTGTYEIEAGLRWLNLHEWRLIVSDPAPDPTLFLYGIIGTTFLTSSIISPDRLSFKLKLHAGCRVYVDVRPKNPNYTIFAQDSFLSVKLVNEILVGSDISLASCLHDRPVKEYIRGVSHRHNLMWFVNTKIKKVYCEPRFDYYLPNIFNNLVRYAGWYSSPKNITPVPMSIDQDSIELPIWDDFGKFLRLSYKESSDPVEAWELKRKTQQDLQPYGVQANFTDRGKDGQTSENPYFTRMYLGFSNTVATIEYALPFILPESTDMDEVFRTDNYNRIIGTLPDPTYTSEPKCAMVFRGKTFIRHQDTISPWGTGAIASYALLMQGNTMSLNYGFTVSEIKNGSYCDTQQYLRGGVQNPNATLGVIVPGLARCFYYTYFAIINEAVKLAGKFSIKAPKISSENFRGLRSITLNGKQSIWILAKIANFKPNTAENVDCEMYKYVEPDQDFIDDNIEHRDMNIAPFNHVNYNAL